jgi:molecular chaperone IbpA
VVEGADVQLGLLHVGLRRVVPEALKPRKVAIGTGAPQTIATTTIANDSLDNAKAA